MAKGSKKTGAASKATKSAKSAANRKPISGKAGKASKAASKPASKAPAKANAKAGVAAKPAKAPSGKGSKKQRKAAAASSSSSSSSFAAPSSISTPSGSGSWRIPSDAITSTEDDDYEESASSSTSFSSQTEFSQSTAARPSLAKLTKERKAALRETYFILGDEKWRESVDGADQKYGKWVYDKCLHKGNFGRTEPGFLKSVLAAQAYIGKELLGKKTTIASWLAVHKIVTRHFVSRRATGTDGTNKKIGGRVQTRRRDHIGGMSGGPHLVCNQGRREIHNLKPKVVRLRHFRFGDAPRRTENGSSYYTLSQSTGEVSEYSAQGYELHFLPMKRKRRIRYFNHMLDRMYYELRKAKSSESKKLAAIVRCHQMMQRLHICRDGTQRTSMLFLNKHLVEAGLPLTILHKPHFADIASLDEYIAEVRAGQAVWQSYVNQRAGSGASGSASASASDDSASRS